METKKPTTTDLSGSSKPETKKEEVNVKTSHPSSNPMNGDSSHSHFEVEVHNAFFRVFNL